MDINADQNLYYYPVEDRQPCYVVNISTQHGIWQSENPLTQAFPLLAMQLAYVVTVSRIVFFLFRPLHIPRLVTDILSGIIVGPSFLGSVETFQLMFPLRSILTVETVAYWALSLHVFLIGLEMDAATITQADTKTLVFGMTAVLLPLVFGFILFYVFTALAVKPNEVATKDPKVKVTPNPFFWATPFIVTGFPVVARTLAELRIIHTDVGRIAMPIAMICDLVSWVFLVILIPSRLDRPFDVPVSFVAAVAFTVFCIYLARPAIDFLIHHTATGSSFNNEFYLCFILASVSVFALMTEFLGTTSLVGAFLFGLIMPDRELAGVLIEKFEDFVSVYLLPLYFACCGMRFQIRGIKNHGPAIMVLVLSSLLKVASGFAAATYLDISHKEGLAIGLVLNTKGILAMVVILIGFDSKKLSQEDYAVLVFSVILTTAMVPPILESLFRPARSLLQHKKRTIQKVKQNGDFRILACLQDVRNVLGTISLLDSSNATKESPLTVFSLHLIELIGRASPMLIAHTTDSNGSGYNGRRDAKSERIVSAFEAYKNLNDLVTVQSLTCLSPFEAMPGDVVNLAEDKQVALILLPFHKLPTGEGGLEEEGIAFFRGTNVNVIANAPCSVAIFVDKGLGEAAGGESNLSKRKICLYFIGGPDDREGLAYAWRMAGSQLVILTVVRFVLGDNVDEIEPIDLPAGDASRLLMSSTYVDRQRRVDDEFVNEFRLKTAGQESVIYEERSVNNDEEMIAAIKEMHHDFDLYIVGKGDGIVSPLTAPMLDWCEFPELGAIGDMLTRASFARGSVLVMHQYGSDASADDLASLVDSEDHTPAGSWRHVASEAHCMEQGESWNNTDSREGGMEKVESWGHTPGMEPVESRGNTPSGENGSEEFKSWGRTPSRLNNMEQVESWRRTSGGEGGGREDPFGTHK